MGWDDNFSVYRCYFKSPMIIQPAGFRETYNIDEKEDHS